jgi:hypothetical protein
LALQAHDHPTGGLHHETARIACGIVAGNAWNGYLSETVGGQPLDLGPDDILRMGKNYFFHVPHPAEGEIGNLYSSEFGLWMNFAHMLMFWGRYLITIQVPRLPIISTLGVSSRESSSVLGTTTHHSL